MRHLWVARGILGLEFRANRILRFVWITVLSVGRNP
jgi:hypothetical protein